jgi:tetratricopeptide (TPR) repeat protein
MKRLIHAQSTREPGVTVIEDLHWIDPATEMFLANHVEAVQGTRGLTVLNFRPEYHARWMSRSYYRQVGLAPLGADALDQLLAELLGRDPALDGLRSLISERTRGNPFFIEELIRSLIEAGGLVGERGAYRIARPIAHVRVPASVEAVLSARIDRLGPRDKSVLQAAAVIGREFPQPILERVADLEAEQLEDSLRNLLAGEFVYEQEPYPESIYAFTHPLTQRVAYGSQLREHRARVHAAVARATADHHQERLDERAALIAQHWEAAGNTLEAARWHARAAEWAGYRDLVGALRHWRRAGELADALPASEENVGLRLAARIRLLDYGYRLGISEEEAEAIFNEAERMASEAGDVRSLVFLLGAYAAVRGLVHGYAPEQADLVRRAFALADRSGDPDLHVAIAAWGIGLFYVGEYREGLAMVDRALELAGEDPGVGAGITMACPYAYCHVVKGGFFLTTMGELAPARPLIERGRDLARDHGDIESVGWSHAMSAWLAYASGELEDALAHAQRYVEIAERIGDAYSRTLAWNMLGWAESWRGEWRRAVESIERAREISKDRTSADLEPAHLAVLAESYLGLGDLERAEALAREGVTVARRRGNVPRELLGSLTLARVLLASDDPATREEIEAVLGRTLELTGEALH